MSNLDNLQDFIEKERKEPRDTQTSGQNLEDMIRRNNEAMAEDREQSRIDSARAGMADAMTARLKEHKSTPTVTLTPEDTGEVAFMKEGGGGAGGAGGAGGLAGGGTVAVASDPGVFSPTYGGDSKRRLGMQPHKKKKKKKKKDKDKYQTSGVTKLDRFLRGEKVNQTRKSVSAQEFAKWLVDDVRKALKPTSRDTTGGTGVNESPTTETHHGPPRNPWGSKGRWKALRGQQGYTDDVKHFVKMENIANTLESQGTVLDLMKALDMDIPVEVN